MNNEESEEKPKKLTVKQAKKTQSSKQLIEKKIKKTEKDIIEVNKETKKLLWEEEREVSLKITKKIILKKRKKIAKENEKSELTKELEHKKQLAIIIL